MITTANDFLDVVYDQLEYNSGQGYFEVADSTSEPNLSQIEWLEQARQLGAKTIFFVDDFPTVLFFELDTDLTVDTADVEEEIRQLFLKVWNTSRVPLFFVALPGELRVYNAYQKPLKPDEWVAEDRWLRRIQSITQVLELTEFSRPEVESGRLFHQRSNDFDRENRVDQWLLKNLRLLRMKLEGSNKEKREYAHALIGRSIFVQYLEDRKVLVADYFTDINDTENYQNYTNVLGNKEDTYRLFHKLRRDFNGDLFPLSGEEESAIEETELHLLRDFLMGRSMGDQPDLLFWAYDFDIIPIELISNIYEDFYHENGSSEDKGTHYTPTSLVDLVLSQSLTTNRLDNGARVLDPACGSGIFLVEAFKRMVFHQCRKEGVDQLSRAELVSLLTDKIVGFDINKSAIQVAAFSLYLAYLDFREPPDIRANKELPKLIYDPKKPENSGRSLYCTNAFYLTENEKTEIEERIANTKRYEGRADDIRASKIPILPIENLNFDIIVGNPPWGSDTSLDGSIPIQWSEAFRYPLGYKELSQCFIWRLQRLLNPGGEIGLLISSGVFFKHQDNSQAFRQQWLTQNKVRAVYNFAHVRRVFFQSAISPFAVIFYTPLQSDDMKTASQNRIAYISIKQQAFVEKLQAVIINRRDFKLIRQNDFLINDWLWKACLWGSTNDFELIRELKDCNTKLEDVIFDYGMGYQEGSLPKKKSTKEFGVDFELRTEEFDKQQDFENLVIPLKHRYIHRVRNTEIYKGPRLLIKRGVSQSGEKFGEISARLAYTPFAFRNSIIGFRLDSVTLQNHKILLGIILSSLTKFYHFLTCSTWGFWHDEIHVEEHLNLPIRFPRNRVLQKKIVDIVDLITVPNNKQPLFSRDYASWRGLQDELDEAIFDLYELSEEQRDLIRDMCQVTLEYYYYGTNAQALKQPSIGWLENYQNAYLEVWYDRLAAKGKELEIRIFAPRNGLVVGIAFELVDFGTAQVHKPITDDASWQKWLRKLSHSLYQKRSSQIYIDRTIKELTESSMFVVKRAERRLWTKSMARQDAQELLTEVFRLEWEKNGEPA